MKKVLLMIIVVALLTGCSANKMQDLGQEIAEIEAQAEKEQVAQAQAVKESAAHVDQSQQATVQEQTGETGDSENEQADSSTQADEASLEEKLMTISFAKVSDYYIRDCVQDDTPYQEMFAVETDCFIRIGTGVSEEEVFSYNYKTTEFTYLYYFENELISKVVYNIGADKVFEDDDNLADLLKTDAQLLKDYFEDLIEEADIEVAQL